MLYIRTQEKLCLTPIKGKIELNILNKNDICVMSKSGWVQLAIYKTQERALEVLDEIEKANEKNKVIMYEHCIGISEKIIEYTYPQVITYQMPKE